MIWYAGMADAKAPRRTMSVRRQGGRDRVRWNGRHRDMPYPSHQLLAGSKGCPRSRNGQNQHADLYGAAGGFQRMSRAPRRAMAATAARDMPPGNPGTARKARIAEAAGLPVAAETVRARRPRAVICCPAVRARPAASRRTPPAPPPALRRWRPRSPGQSSGRAQCTGGPRGCCPCRRRPSPCRSAGRDRRG